MFFSSINMINLLVEVEILILSFVISKNQKRRKNYPLRLITFSLLALTISYFLPVIELMDHLVLSIFSAIFLYVILIFISGLVVFLCYDVKLKSAILIASGGYALQHISSELGALVNPFLYLALPNEFHTLVQYCTMVIFDVITVFVTLQFLKKYEIKDTEIKTNRLLYFVIAVITSTIVLSTFTNIFYSAINEFTREYLLSLFNFLCALFLVYILIRLLSEKKLENELVVIEELMKEEAKQYEFSKQNIEAINIKCHDLKYRIRALKDSNKLKADSLDDLENDIKIYDSYFKTGNDALDVLLTEKALFCKQNNIDLSVMADGRHLSFMTNYDIYSLFGNALSNAIEAVNKVEDKAKRNILFTLSLKGKYITLHIENYFKNINIANGKMMTTKEDKINHGFGVISMKHIASEYGGNVVLSQENDLFITDITLLYNV